MTLDEFRAHLRTLSKEKQYERLCEVAYRYSEFLEQTDEVGAILTALAESFGFGEKMQEDVDTWEKVKQASDRSHENARKKSANINTLQNFWGMANLSEIPELYHMSNTSIKKIISLTKVSRDHKHSWTTVKKALLKAQAFRISNPSKGTSNVLTVQPSDADRAREYLESGEAFIVSRSELLQINKGRNRFGLICDLSEDVGDIDIPLLIEEQSETLGMTLRPRGAQQRVVDQVEEDEELEGEEIDSRARSMDERYMPEWRKLRLLTMLVRMTMKRKVKSK